MTDDQAPAISLANLPATAEQRRAVFVIAVLMVLALAAVMAFAAAPMPRIDGFIPALQSVIFINDLITAILLFAQYSIAPSRALLVLACSYLFTALIVVVHLLTFPGAFAPTGLLGAGPQSTAWLYYIWHAATPVGVLAYASLKDAGHANKLKHDPRSAAWWSVIIVIALVCAFTWLVTQGDRFLPTIMAADGIRASGVLWQLLGLLIQLTAAAAIAVLWTRRRSVLDYWLMLVVFAVIIELSCTALFGSARFTLGWYAGRIYSLIISVAVLVLLLEEINRLYARLARSNLLLERERDNRLMNVHAITAAIAHEVKQPLTGIVMMGSAALRFLNRDPPDHAEVRHGLEQIIAQGRRASEVFDGLRALFLKGNQPTRPINVNRIVSGVLQSLSAELKDHNVEVHTELSPELPLVQGYGSQLEEVIVNLVRNAVEAMETTTGPRRVLNVVSVPRGDDAIVVTVKDTGSGIDPERLRGIFSSFTTTKPKGTGLGLAICNTIVQRHGGQLTASSDGKTGASFQFILPLKSPVTAAT
jgi:signal transduction histidine kinase